MENHSPAPWKETEDDDGNIVVIMDENHSALMGNLEGSCSICHANARLVCCAPDMLDSLERIQKWLEDSGKKRIFPVIYADVSRVIEKATGQQVLP